jgi:type III secretory pathway component EscT
MSPSALFFHLLNFSAPAVTVALLVACSVRIVAPRQAAFKRWWASIAINSIVGVLVLVAGLWHYGVDGKMATYAALAMAVGTSQWLQCRFPGAG